MKKLPLLSSLVVALGLLAGSAAAAGCVAGAASAGFSSSSAKEIDILGAASSWAKAKGDRLQASASIRLVRIKVGFFTEDW